MKKAATKITSLFLSLFLLAGLAGGSVEAQAASIPPEESIPASQVAEEAADSQVPESAAEPEAPASSQVPSLPESSLPEDSSAPDDSSVPEEQQPEDSAPQPASSLPEAPGSSLPSPAPASSEVEAEPAEDAIAPQAGLSSEQLLETARKDGAAAAELLNALEDDEAYRQYLRQVLDLYFGEELAEQLAAFRTVIDDRAAELLARYDVAAAERADALNQGFLPGELLVVFEEEPDAVQASAMVQSMGGEMTETIDSGEETMAVAELPLDQTVAEAAAQYTETPGVSFAQPNYVYFSLEDTVEETQAVSSNDPELRHQYYLNQVNAGDAWNVLQQAAYANRSPVLVSVIDTGCYTGHADLQGSVDLARSADFSTGARGPLQGDQGEHGTHVIGTIAARTNNGVGVAGIANAPKKSIASVMAVNVFQYMPGYSKPVAMSSTLAPAINYSVAQGARVINLSLGHYGHAGASDVLIESTINNATAKGVLVVCAAGNDATTRTMYPSDFANSFSVIALAENSSNRAYFSDYGPSKDIAAPGVSILNTVPPYSSGGSIYQYKKLDGTSMAAPVVTAAAAMVMFANPDLSAQEVRNLLTSTAARGQVGRDDYVGWGCVNIGKAVYQAAMQAGAMRTVKLPGTETIYAGQSKQLVAAIEPAGARNSSLIWESSNPAVATVSGGIVTGVAIGDAVITASLNNGQKAQCTVSVKSGVTGVRTAQKTVTLVRGKSVTIPATVYTSGGPKVALTWKSSRPGVASVNGKGTIKARNVGSTVITATAPGGKSARITVKVVKKAIQVARVKFSGLPKTMAVGKTKFITARVIPSNATSAKVTFKSSNPSVVRIDAAGKITARKEGRAIITLTAGGRKASAAVRVTAPPARKITLNKNQATLRKGSKTKLNFTIVPSDASQKVTFTSSNKKVATVTKTGVVKGVGKGKCTITVKTASGKKATCRVRVI